MMLWVIAPVLLPLIGGLLQLVVGRFGLPAQRVLGLLLAGGLVALGIKVLALAQAGDTLVYNLGNWPAPFGIVLVLDRLAAMMVLLTSVLAVAALGYANLMRVDEKGSHFHVMFQLQLFGLNGAFLTGDVFNLFVFFEVLLLASYGLLLHGAGAGRTRAGLHYVVINLIGSTLFLFAVGALYGAVGTLNIADMAQRVAAAPAERSGLIAAAGLLLLVVFALKAAMFPLYLWLPQAYANTSAPVAAFFAMSCCSASPRSSNRDHPRRWPLSPRSPRRAPHSHLGRGGVPDMRIVSPDNGARPRSAMFHRRFQRVKHVPITEVP